MYDKIHLITSNIEKVEAAKVAFEDTAIELRRLDKGYCEIQAPNSLEIAKHTVKQALDDIDTPVIREDHSFYLDAIPGFPGPYISYFDKNLPAEKLLQILEGHSRTGYFEIATVLGLPSSEIKEYVTKVPIEISERIRGEEGNWERLMMLEGENKTFSETDSDTRIRIWNQNFREIANFMEKNM